MSEDSTQVERVKTSSTTVGRATQNSGRIFPKFSTVHNALSIYDRIGPSVCTANVCPRRIHRTTRRTFLPDEVRSVHTCSALLRLRLLALKTLLLLISTMDLPFLIRISRIRCLIQCHLCRYLSGMECFSSHPLSIRDVLLRRIWFRMTEVRLTAGMIQWTIALTHCYEPEPKFVECEIPLNTANPRKEIIMVHQQFSLDLKPEDFLESLRLTMELPSREEQPILNLAYKWSTDQASSPKYTLKTSADVETCFDEFASRRVERVGRKFTHQKLTIQRRAENTLEM